MKRRAFLTGAIAAPVAVVAGGAATIAETSAVQAAAPVDTLCPIAWRHLARMLERAVWPG